MINTLHICKRVQDMCMHVNGVLDLLVPFLDSGLFQLSTLNKGKLKKEETSTKLPKCEQKGGDLVP